jgi:hypothetical protein
MATKKPAGYARERRRQESAQLDIMYKHLWKLYDTFDKDEKFCPVSKRDLEHVIKSLTYAHGRRWTLTTAGFTASPTGVSGDYRAHFEFTEMGLRMLPRIRKPIKCKEGVLGA